MKIWKAELILFCNIKDEYETIFNFELQEDDFKINEKFDEWIYAEDWICTRIPMKITIERGYSLKAKQGFDHELNKIELEELKKTMMVVLQEDLDIQKQLYLSEHNLKSIVLNKYKSEEIS